MARTVDSRRVWRIGEARWSLWIRSSSGSMGQGSRARSLSQAVRMSDTLSRRQVITLVPDTVHIAKAMRPSWPGLHRFRGPISANPVWAWRPQTWYLLPRLLCRRSYRFRGQSISNRTRTATEVIQSPTACSCSGRRGK